MSKMFLNKEQAKIVDCINKKGFNNFVELFKALEKGYEEGLISKEGLDSFKFKDMIIAAREGYEMGEFE